MHGHVGQPAHRPRTLRHRRTGRDPRLHLGGQHRLHEGRVIGDAGRRELLGEHAEPLRRGGGSAQPGRLPFEFQVAHRAIDTVGGTQQIGPLRACAHRQEAPVQRRHRGQHRVERTVGGQVVHIGDERLVVEQVVPHRTERGTGHHGMADDVVRRAHQHLTRITRDAHEHLIGLFDNAFTVRGREEHVVESELLLGAVGIGRGNLARDIAPTGIGRLCAHSPMSLDRPSIRNAHSGSSRAKTGPFRRITRPWPASSFCIKRLLDAAGGQPMANGALLLWQPCPMLPDAI
ncbi:hypothetical protein MAJHIDBO_00986 [Propionibacterium freudenreichii subsp. shermanii]|nr:hypothetical protein MAJHIDBO_00986 [Propionibacterium freudenreichii subsp. shermanii]SPS08783.1 hypothetical protein MAJHIDBO_00986 [Propionibacterium freudenreichii subsp. shermanii]